MSGTDFNLFLSEKSMKSPPTVTLMRNAPYALQEELQLLCSFNFILLSHPHITGRWTYVWGSALRA